ncbi:MAG: BrxA/BrxB family bacilliredoxin [Planctomycetota bacterium]|nr:BrxA/BrxB family bacilliredoxin [Planctomycetota bacterium]
MPYDPMLVQPMREDMTSMNAEELLDAAAVDAFMAREGTKLLFVNSVCGCAAGQARPALRIALQHGTTPDHVGTVFAGQDLEATAKARGYFEQVPPSSPSAALFKGGDLVHFVPRHMIESRDANTIAFDLVSAFDEHCA